jgi:hypothetical protein
MTDWALQEGDLRWKNSRYLTWFDGTYFPCPVQCHHLHISVIWRCWNAFLKCRASCWIRVPEPSRGLPAGFFSVYPATLGNTMVFRRFFRSKRKNQRKVSVDRDSVDSGKLSRVASVSSLSRCCSTSSLSDEQDGSSSDYAEYHRRTYAAMEITRR